MIEIRMLTFFKPLSSFNSYTFGLQNNEISFDYCRGTKCFFKKLIESKPLMCFINKWISQKLDKRL